MNLESQVCSVELSQRLKELGVRQASYFVWFKLKESGDWHLTERWQASDLDRFHEISAFTVSELGEMLPVYIEKGEGFSSDVYALSMYIEDMQYLVDPVEGQVIPRSYSVNYFRRDQTFKHIADESEANARAKMLIWLIEEGLVKVSE